VQFVKESLTFAGEDSATSNLLLSVMAAFAEFERSLLPEAITAETLYELKLDYKVSAAAHIRSFAAFHHHPAPRYVAFHPWGTKRHERASTHPR
jgi:hypothetical protein